MNPLKKVGIRFLKVDSNNEEVGDVCEKGFQG